MSEIQWKDRGIIPYNKLKKKNAYQSILPYM